MTMIFHSLVLSKTQAYIARPWTRG